jgi:hypothetical protein
MDQKKQWERQLMRIVWVSLSLLLIGFYIISPLCPIPESYYLGQLIFGAVTTMFGASFMATALRELRKHRKEKGG